MKMSESLIKLMSSFQDQGFSIRIVGGAVRDSLLGIEPKDIDLATDATPEQMVQVASTYSFSIIPTGLQHGTMTFLFGREQFEVTTLRIDVETDGRHAKVEYTADWAADAARRDLTINAMSMDVDGNIFDYSTGREDLSNARICFMGDADARVKEDYLRILRYFRFLARFGNVGESLGDIAVITTPENLRGLSETISVERYWLEMQKLVMEPGAEEVLAAMYYNNVLAAIGLDAARNFVPTKSPVVNLGSMIPTESLESFLSRWKMSASEQAELRYFVTNREAAWSVWDAFAVELELVRGRPRSWVVETARTIGDGDGLAYHAEMFAIPSFPVRGQDLLEAGMTPGPEVGQRLNRMWKTWEHSTFTLTKAELMDMVL